MKGCLFFLLFISTWAFSDPASRPVNLRTNHKTDPAGVDTHPPYFSWWIEAAGRGYVQGGYQLLVASSEDKLRKGEADIWDSGKVRSDENLWVLYEGPSLEPARRYYWKVRIRDRLGKVSAWSETASFTTGLAGEKDWKNADWIALELLPDSLKVMPGVHGSGNELGRKAVKRAVIPYFRKSFSIEKPLKAAYVFVSGLGQYELHLNGEKVGDDFLTPGWTDYRDRCLYNSYDVTSQLQQGENVLGGLVGTGFFYVNRERYRKLVIAQGYPMFRLKLVLRFTDGTSREVVTDESWKTSPSPLIFSSIYGGESYDARLEQAGWDGRGFDDSGWKPVLISQGPGGQMKPQMEYPLQVMDTLETLRISEPAPGKYVYDFGQNASGIISLQVLGQKGDTVRITPGELLDENGVPTQRASGGPYYFEYVLKGNDLETWQARFTYYGFRFALVEGAVPAVPVDSSPQAEVPAPFKNIAAGETRVHSLQFLHTRNSAPTVGTFSCSSPLFNQIHELIDWSIRSNLASVTTDCPHREKLGWLEQAHLMGSSIKYRYDILHLYNKVVDDMIEAQLPNGLVPDIAPEFVPFEGGFRDSPEWGSASVIIPWYLYQWYGDKEVLVRAYDMMSRYLAYLGGKAEGHILSHGLGDWFDLGPEPPGPSQLTPIPLTATAIYYYDAHILSQVAELLGKKDDSRRYRELAAAIKHAFNAKFFNSAAAVYATGSQTSFAMPLYMGLVPENRRENVFSNLLDSVKASGKALTAGDVGYRYLVRVLEQGGASRLLYEMNNRDDVPGYGFQIARGATALTESWAALKYVSNNHMMLGHLMEWLYSGLAGIGQREGSTACREIKIAPQPVEGIDEAQASYHAISGKITVHWKKSEEEFRLKTAIPPNTRADIHLPAAALDQVREGGQPIKKQEWLQHVRPAGKKLVLTVLPGSYDFTVAY